MIRNRILLSIVSVLLLSRAALAQAPIKPVVEVEEDVYRYEDPANGSGPFWCFGSSCMVRIGEQVLVSGLEKIADAKPLNNTRWLLFARTIDGWKLQQKDPAGRTREPSPLGALPDGSLLMSVNPTLTPPDTYSGPARPEILRFANGRWAEPPQTILPAWDGNPRFTEHSYRSFAVDGGRGEIIVMQNIGYTHSEWAFRDSAGQWSAHGQLKWPWGAEYAKPEPIRVCYPTVQLRDRAVYFCGVSDIVEPNPTWRQYKQELTKREWDYDFRRLFFTWCSDISSGQFKPWVEVASREKTCGWIMPCDLWADAKGTVHILWSERAIDTRLRDKFFPEAKQSEALNYATVKDGVVTSRHSILMAEEGSAQAIPGRGRFHMTSDGRLFIFYYAQARDASGRRTGENRLGRFCPMARSGRSWLSR